MIGQAGVTQVNPINPYQPYRYVDPKGSIYELGYYSYMQFDQGYFPFFTRGAYGFTYNFNPAGIQSVVGGTPYTVSQVSEGHPLMSLNNYVFSYNPSNNITTLTGPSIASNDCARSANVQLICSSTTMVPIFSFVNESPTCVYNFNFVMNCALASSTPYLRYIQSSSGNHSLSVTIIILLSILSCVLICTE